MDLTDGERTACNSAGTSMESKIIELQVTDQLRKVPQNYNFLIKYLQTKSLSERNNL